MTTIDDAEPKRSANIAPVPEPVDAATRIAEVLLPMDNATRWETLQKAFTTLRCRDESSIDASSGIKRTVILLPADDSDEPIPTLRITHW